MTYKRRAFIGAVGSTVALSGCLGSSGSSSGPATVQVMSHDEHGDILVGPDEMALYNFDKDTNSAGASACYDGCAEAWPPLTVEDSPTKGDDVAAELSTFERDGGATQVVAAGWPLYHFQSNEEPGDVNGQGVNDVWWLLRPDGTLIK